MLPKKHRLTKNKDFQELYKKGASVFLPPLALRYKKIGKNKNSRFGFVVSNKIYKKSTARNLLKRRLRAMVNNKLKQILPGFDCVITTRAKIRGKNYQQIEEDLERLFTRAKILNKI